MHKNAAAPIIVMLGHSEVDMEVQVYVWKPQNLMIIERCQKIIEMLMGCWLWHEKEQDFSTKIDRSLSTNLPSQLVDCVR